MLEKRKSKKIAATDAIFGNIQHKGCTRTPGVKRLSLDCKATVVIGDYSRGGKTRGDWRAQDHDMGRNEKYIPVGIVDEDSGQLYLKGWQAPLKRLHLLD